MFRRELNGQSKSNRRENEEAEEGKWLDTCLRGDVCTSACDGDTIQWSVASMFHALGCLSKDKPETGKTSDVDGL